MTSKQTYSEGLKLLLQISRLVRNQSKSGKAMNQPVIELMRQWARRHDATEERICRRPGELTFLAQTYRTYLESGAKYRECFHKFHGKGERSVEEAARLVGLEVPKKPE